MKAKEDNTKIIAREITIVFVDGSKLELEDVYTWCPLPETRQLKVGYKNTEIDNKRVQTTEFFNLDKIHSFVLKTKVDTSEC